MNTQLQLSTKLDNIVGNWSDGTIDERAAMKAVHECVYEVEKLEQEIARLHGAGPAGERATGPKPLAPSRSEEPSEAKSRSTGPDRREGSAQEQPTEGKHPSSVKGIEPPRYFTQEEVKAILREIDEELRGHHAELAQIAMKHGITDL